MVRQSRLYPVDLQFVIESRFNLIDFRGLVKVLFCFLILELFGLVLYMRGYTQTTHIVYHAVLEKGVNYIQKPFTVEGFSKKVMENLFGNWILGFMIFRLRRIRLFQV